MRLPDNGPVRVFATNRTTAAGVWTMPSKTTSEEVVTYGAGNLKIEETEACVTIQFDPRRIIGEFKSGNPKVCSTGAYRPLDLPGTRFMLHVIGQKPVATS